MTWAAWTCLAGQHVFASTFIGQASTKHWLWESDNKTTPHGSCAVFYIFVVLIW